MPRTTPSVAVNPPDIRLNGDVAYWLADTARSRFLYMSAGFEPLWSCSLAQLHEQPARYLQAIHPDDLTRFSQGQASASGRQQRHFRVRQPDGSYRLVGECRACRPRRRLAARPGGHRG